MNRGNAHPVAAVGPHPRAERLMTLARDPHLLLRTLSARVRPPPRAPLRKAVGGVIFEFDFSAGPLVRQMYYDLYEPETIHALRRLLQPGDTFVDAGANIGYISTVALGLVGPAGRVHSFEPVPAYFGRLQQVARTNRTYNLVVNPWALGDVPGTATIHINGAANIGWNTLVPGFMHEASRQDTREVPVRRLDTYLSEQGLTNVALIKIDTEGYELPILRGLSGYLDGPAPRPHIICEVAPAAYPLLGHTLADLAACLLAYGYCACTLGRDPAAVDVTRLTETTTVLLVPCA